jgi:prepilin-type N-terminal cleavage/methylation domain-containing protein
LHVLHRVRGQPGFTLAEMMVVCAVFGLLLVMAVPMFRTTMENVRVRGAAGTLVSNIRLAQEYAQRHARPARIVFDPAANSYEIQVAVNPGATDSCTDTNFESVARVQVDPQDRVRLAEPMVPCLVFESTGRTAWMNPQVIQYQTPAPIDKDGNGTFFLNGFEWDAAKPAKSTEEIVTWVKTTSPVSPVIVIDLQRFRHMESLCARVIYDRSADRVPFPKSITLDWAPSVQGDDPPTGSEWVQLQKKEPPYRNVRPILSFWDVSCDPFEIDREVRYLRFRFETQKLPGATAFAMALDEIRIDLSSISLVSDSGRVVRKVSVAPITGRVSVD